MSKEEKTIENLQWLRNVVKLDDNGSRGRRGQLMVLMAGEEKPRNWGAKPS
jgi:hypothetical protein